MKYWKPSILFLLCIIIFASINLNSAYKKAPSFALVNNKNKFIFKSHYKGNLIISFWASYCKPCKKEMPVMVELEKKYGKSKNIQLVFINVDDNKGSSAKKKADGMLESLGIKHDYLLDPYQKTIIKYNPKRNVPSTFLVNKKGYIVLTEIGYHENTMEKLEKAISRL